MLSQETLAELNKAFVSSLGGFLIVDSGQPKFAVLSYQAYQTLAQGKDRALGAKPKILVTGGAGYIGSHTVRILQKQGYEVTVFDNLSTGRREAVRGCKLVEGDLADRSVLDQAFAEGDFDAVIHFAASIEVEESVANPGKYFQNNFVNGLNLLEAMVKHNVSKLVFSSTAAVYGEPASVPVAEDAICQPSNPYGESKLMFERALKWYQVAHGLNSATLRYFNAAGAWAEEGLGYNIHHPTHLIPRVLDVACRKTAEIEIFGNDYSTTDGTGVRDFIHVLDLAEAHTVALEKLGNAEGAYVYNVGTGQGTSVLEIIEKTMELTGHMVPMTVSNRRSGDPARLVADSRKLQTEFGWKPKHDLTSIIQSAWEWHKSA